jgi:hypothetical protein
MRRNGGVKILPGHLERAKSRLRVLADIDIRPTDASRGEMRCGEFIGFFEFALGESQSFSGQKLLLAIIVFVIIDFTLGGGGLEVEHDIDKSRLRALKPSYGLPVYSTRSPRISPFVFLRRAANAYRVTAASSAPLKNKSEGFGCAGNYKQSTPSGVWDNSPLRVQRFEPMKP